MQNKVAIGIVSSLSHHPDILPLKSVIKRISDDSDIQKRCKFVICGYLKGNKKWEEILKIFKQNPKMEVEVREALSVDKYMEHYNFIDILLCPLEVNEFNFCKSSLKLNEAACKNIPVIASELYLGKETRGCIPIKNKADWFKAIKMLLKDDNYKKYGVELGDFNKKAFSFDKRLSDLKLMLQYVMEKEEKVPDNLKIYGITYKEDQYTEFEDYFNPIKTIGERSYLFEYNPIVDIVSNKVDNIKDNDYLGIFSYKFVTKTGISRKILNRVFEDVVERESPDIIGLAPSYFKGNYMSFSEQEHPGLVELLILLCQDLGLNYIEEPKNIVYSNFFLAKKAIYKDYVDNYVKPAIELLEEKYKDLAWKDANYQSGLKGEELKNQTGLDYYSMHTFTLERLFSQYVDNKGFRFTQIN